MISVIICSVNPTLLENIKKNIGQTIGTSYEIIAVDNREKNQGICRVYNDAVKLATYPYLCFVHEDVAFETKDWGLKVVSHLSAPSIGLIGFAGGDTKSQVPSPWSVSAISNEINMIRHRKGALPDTEHQVVTAGNSSFSRSKVAALDGFCLCTKKEVFNHFRFDEDLFTGFHGYDMDFSLQVRSKFEVCVVFDILVRHFSEGNPEKNWLESTIRISRKWKHRLPASVYALSQKTLTSHHWHSLRVFMDNLLRLKYSRFVMLRFFFKYSATRYFSVGKFLSLGKYLFISFLKKP